MPARNFIPQTFLHHGKSIEEYFFLVVIFVCFVVSEASALESCHPYNSKLDFDIETTDGKFCNFPFYYLNKLHYDCVNYNDSMVNFFCPTNCQSGEFQQCKWLRSHVNSQTCADIAYSRIDRDIETRQYEPYCKFPFIYHSKCYNDCIDLNYDGKLWCSPHSLYDIRKKFQYSDCFFKKSWINVNAAIPKGYYSLSPVCDVNMHCNKILAIAKEVKFGKRFVAFLPLRTIKGAVSIFKIQPLHRNQIMIFLPRTCSPSGETPILSGNLGSKLIVDAPKTSQNVSTLFYEDKGDNTFELVHKNTKLGTFLYLGLGALKLGNETFSYSLASFSSQRVKWKLTRHFISEPDFESTSCSIGSIEEQAKTNSDIGNRRIQLNWDQVSREKHTDSPFLPVISTTPRSLHQTTYQTENERNDPTLIIFISVLCGFSLFCGLIVFALYRRTFINQFCRQSS